MAIKQEHYNVNGHDFIRTTSDSGRYVVRDGVSYEEACDPAEFGRTYTEGELMPVDDSEAARIIEAKAEAYDILIGDEQNNI